MDNPLPGNWVLKIKALEVLPEGENVIVNFSGIVETPPTVRISGLKDGAVLKHPAVIQGYAHDPDGLNDFIFFLNQEYASVVALDEKAPPCVVNATYNIDPAGLPDGRYTIIAWAADTRNTFWGESLDFIVDNLPPVADAGPDREVELGQTATFDATGSKDGAWYLWDFGDGTECEGGPWPYGEHAYNRPGDYSVTLTVYDDAENTAVDTARVKVRAGAIVRRAFLPVLYHYYLFKLCSSRLGP